MAKIEPGVYEPRDDIRVFDGAEGDIDEEGSRLPLLIVIALLVLASFGGVVYLAYTEGVQKGRADAPRVITAEAGPAKVSPTDAGGTVTPYKGLKIYEQPAPADDSADEDTAPIPPTEIKPAGPSVSAPVAPSAALTRPPVATTVTALPSPPKVKPTPKETVAQTLPAPQQVATQLPKSLAPPTATKPAPIETKVAPSPPPAIAPTTGQAASGTYVLQIGSYKSEAEANAAWAFLKGKHGALVNAYSPNVKQVDLGAKGTWYRLRIGSFADKGGATSLCQSLGGGCFPAKR